MTHYGLSLLGYGGVNRALVEILARKGDALKEAYGLSLSVVSVSDLFLGYAHDANGLDLKQLIALPAEKGALVSFTHQERNE